MLSENEIEAMKELGGEELYQQYLQYMKDKELLEKELEKLPERLRNERAIIKFHLKFLEVDIVFIFIFAILLRSKIIDEEQKKNIESFKSDKRFFT